MVLADQDRRSHAQEKVLGGSCFHCSDRGSGDLGVGCGAGPHVAQRAVGTDLVALRAGVSLAVPWLGADLQDLTGVLAERFPGCVDIAAWERATAPAICSACCFAGRSTCTRPSRT